MTNCIFCKIAHKEIASYLIKESDNFMALLDIHPHAPGHSLVIPKEHFANLKEFKIELSSEFIGIIKETMLILSKALETDSFTLGINEGAFAGQAINHLHFHIMPRFKGDGGGSIHSVVNNPSKWSLEEIYQKIKNASKS